MRRFYITSHDVWQGDHEFSDGVTLPRFNVFCPRVGSHYIHLVNYSDPAHAELHNDDPAAWESLPEVQAWRAAGAHILISADFHSEAMEETWHAHPEVGLLPHPRYEGTIQLQELHKSPAHVEKKFTIDHLNSLSQVGIIGAHTVWDVHRIAAAIKPDVRLSNTF